MTDTFTESPAEPASDRFQVLAAIVLGIAATLTALAAFNAALKDGEALQNYTQSTRELSDANFFWSASRDVYSSDFTLFVQFAAARTEGNTVLEEYLYELMRPELQGAITWWEQTEDAVTPFDEAEDNPYVIEEEAEAQLREDNAANLFAQGAEADDNGDEFELAAVFFALTLFFGGIATLFSKRSVTLGLLAVSLVTLAVGGVNLIGAF